MNYAPWMMSVSISATLISLIALLLSVRNRNRDEFNGRFDTIDGRLDAMAGEIRAFNERQGRLDERFKDHEARDREIWEQIQSSLAGLRQDLRGYFVKPDHEDDVPVTRRELRHESDNWAKVYKIIMDRLDRIEQVLASQK